MAGELVEFEGMKLTAERVERIRALRGDGQTIKDGIDLEHVYSANDLVNVFKIALGRAERERELMKALGPD